MLAQRSQETIEIIEELDALEHNCSVRIAAPTEKIAPSFLFRIRILKVRKCYGPLMRREGGPGFEFASSPVNPALLPHTYEVIRVPINRGTCLIGYFPG